MDELRRAYHDRIGDLRSRTGSLVVAAADAVEVVTAALLEGDPAGGHRLLAELAAATDEPRRVEDEVLDILALEAPMGRDLRVVLASLFIAQAAGLCLGLARTLAGRVITGDGVLTPTLRALAYEIGAQTVALLRRAVGAWAVLDEAAALALIADAEPSRLLQRRFLAELFGLSGVPVETAVDLGMLARAYERLTDHAVSIAGRVVFAATGSPPDVAVVRGERG
jgi:phosphate transport system protein